jgi:hypothetical protein
MSDNRYYVNLRPRRAELSTLLNEINVPSRMHGSSPASCMTLSSLSFLTRCIAGSLL